MINLTTIILSIFLGLSGFKNFSKIIEESRTTSTKSSNIKFNIEGKNYAYNVMVVASPIKKFGNTSISIATTLPEAASLSLNFIFSGQATGDYKISTGFDPAHRNKSGLGFRFEQPTKRLSYDLEAQNIQVQVTTYTKDANGRPAVEGTFSGTLIDKKMEKTYQLKDGFFSTIQTQ